MAPLPLDERRVGKLAAVCDAIDEESPRRSDWKARHTRAYAELANACNLAARNAQGASS